MHVAARLTLASCAVAVALAAAGCGGGGGDTTGTVGSPSTTVAAGRRSEPVGSGSDKAAKPPAAPAGERCQAQIGGFLASMEALRKRLVVGVTYEQYVDEIHAVRATYRRIPVRALGIDCLDAAGTPGEEAFNRYIGAANTWGECVSEAGCDSAQVEPVLQRKWKIASHLLGEAGGGLRQVDG